MSESLPLGRHPASPGRFVPKGVDAQSWLGFEQRIQERRYQVLLETMRTHIAAGDAAAARAALTEARELRPDGEELLQLELALASIPLSRPHAVPFFRSRAFSAAAMLIAGITLLTAIDYLRSDQGTARVIQAPVMHLPMLRVPLPPIADIPRPGIEARAPEPLPIGTSGLDVRLDGEVNIPESLRESTVTIPESLPPPPGETPDDFVYPRATPAVSTTRAVPGPAASVNVTRAQPAPANPVNPPSPPASLALPAAVATTPVPPARSVSPPAAAPTPGTSSSSASAAVAPRAVVVPASPLPTPSNPATFGQLRPRPSGQSDDSKVAEVLRAYARAYGDLDAAAAREVWPSVDERALARAFSTLSAQTLSFADCRIDVRGVTALAACRGYASYVGKVGGGGRRTEPRQWRFELRRVGDDWRIQNAEARRQ